MRKWVTLLTFCRYRCNDEYHLRHRRLRDLSNRFKTRYVTEVQAVEEKHARVAYADLIFTDRDVKEDAKEKLKLTKRGATLERLADSVRQR